MKPEYSPRPGATWEAVLLRGETVTPDPDDPEPTLPRPNRKTRRALDRARRKKPR